VGDEKQINPVDKIDPICAPDAKILVVDDNKINLGVACGLLQLYKITADTALSGVQAIEMIQQNQYDIVFMDHMMPEMDGIEATQIIRKMGITIPIIAFSANAVQGFREKFLAAGMNDLLTKPISNISLNKMLANWLPAEKLLTVTEETPAVGSDMSEAQKKFRNEIEKIEAITVQTGLDRVAGQWDVYKKSLKLITDEVKKTNENLQKFLSDGDMNNFRIEVHGMKGALANIGAGKLAASAFELEKESENENISFCTSNLPRFLEDIRALSSRIAEVFENESKDLGPIEIPPELPPLFDRLKAAFDKEDFSAMDEAVASMDALNPNDDLKEEMVKIKDAVTMMDYETALQVMKELENIP
jgi:CheY-like chemotaxis protein/HPt (histidine-containing phosphotransfer) domain-containing protein